MVERIRTLLESRQLTPTQFADAIGVARPIVSHILSGRNKPSLEVVQRILAAMPDLSMPWLLNGTGPMQASSVATVPATPANPAPSAPETAKPAPVQPVAAPSRPEEARPEAQIAPGERQIGATAGTARPMPRRFTALTHKTVSGAATSTASAIAHSASTPAPLLATIEQSVIEHKAAEPDVASIQEPALVKEQAPAVDSTAADLFAGSEKPIRRIVIFYRDGSFADYQPE